MRSTMMDVPLTVTSIMRYGTTTFGRKEVVTNTGDGVRRPEEGGLETTPTGNTCGSCSVRDIIDGRAATALTAHLPPMGLHDLPLTMLTISGLRQANPQPFCKVHSETHSPFFE